MTAAVDVITGAGSGIGRALARVLLERRALVVGVGRHTDTLEETGQGVAGYEPVVADLSTEHGRDVLIDRIGARRVRYLVHNAGTLEPVGALAGISLAQWRAIQALNVEAPLFLTQALIDNLAHGRVLHVSSGAAHRAVPGWGAYCTSKAALHMLYRILSEELRDRRIGVGSLRPGVVDTAMQELIRSKSETDFPDVARFRALKREGALETPESVARFILAVLEIEDPDAFSAIEWDIRDHGHRFNPRP